MTNTSEAPQILIVDDDPTMQILLASMVKKSGYTPITAESAATMQVTLDTQTDDIAAMILDRNLTDADGLDLLQDLKQNHNFPVIMQSGTHDPAQIKAMITGGAFHYLSKPYEPETLEQTLKAAIYHTALKNTLTKTDIIPTPLFTSASFTIETTKDAEDLALFLARLFPDPAQIFTALLALMQNAAEHGIPPIEVEFIQKQDRKSVRITDKGEGFDWKSWEKFDTKRDHYINGYGILKAYKAFDEIKYSAAGNKVIATLYT